jgi:hypothetical protein
MSEIMQPEAAADKSGDITQIPNELMQELNRIENNSTRVICRQTALRVQDRIFFRNERPDEQEAAEQQ